VDTYDPANDVVRFSINIVSPRPLRFSNNLVDMDLEVMHPGLVLAGTNQRVGARGLLRILPDSKLQLRNNEFLVREGFVRFDDPDDPSVALSSDPALSKEDIILLLTLGMTRAELDRGAASALGESVGLEALSSLTGADRAVKKIVPLIDEFRFGTGYSSRTAR